jgi:hypothetical protein
LFNSGVLLKNYQDLFPNKKESKLKI